MRLVSFAFAALGASLLMVCAAPSLTRAQEADRKPRVDPPTAPALGTTDENVERSYTLLKKYSNKSMDQRAVAAAPDFAVMVEVSEEFRATVPPEVMRGWVEDELKRTAPRAVLLTREQQRARYLGGPESDIFQHVVRLDNGLRYLYVELGVLTLDDGSKVYQIITNFNRATLGPTGIVLTPAFARSTYGYLGSSLDSKVKFQDRVEKMVRTFAEEWSRGNPPE